jgi:lysophospholipase
MDCRGHGRSGGIRGHVNRFEQYLEDLDQFLLRVQSEYAVDIPIFLLGHSQGGHIILRYGIENPKQSLAGMIVSSPYLGLTARIPRAMLVAAHLMSKIWPTFSQTPPIEKAHLTHDPEIIEETRRDPLYLHSVTARWYIETLRSQVETMRRAGDFQFPLLMQQAGDDLLVDQESASNFFERIGSQHKRRIEYPDYFHEIYNETADRRCSVFVDLHNWLDQQIQNHVR